MPCHCEKGGAGLFLSGKREETQKLVIFFEKKTGNDLQKRKNDLYYMDNFFENNKIL